MTNLYDITYALEQAIRESNDFKQLKNLYDLVMNDGTSRHLYDSFREMQMHLQHKQMIGQEVSEEDFRKAQQQFELIQHHELISRLMVAEERMMLIINDINKVMMKPLEQLYGVSEQLK